jgi:hypothetical protein
VSNWFVKNRFTSSGIAVLVLGLFTVFLGLASLLNYSEYCYVHPEGGCWTQYQIALLAPLYPIGADLMLAGTILVAAAVGFIMLGSSRIKPGVVATGVR